MLCTVNTLRLALSLLWSRRFCPKRRFRRENASFIRLLRLFNDLVCQFELLKLVNQLITTTRFWCFGIAILILRINRLQQLYLFFFLLVKPSGFYESLNLVSKRIVFKAALYEVLFASDLLVTLSWHLLYLAEVVSHSEHRCTEKLKISMGRDTLK